MSSGCGCKEVYRFPHIIYPYILSLCICSFLQQHPYFLLIFYAFVLVPVQFCNLFNIFSRSKTNIRATMGVSRKPFEGLHIMF